MCLRLLPVARGTTVRRHALLPLRTPPPLTGAPANRLSSLRRPEARWALVQRIQVVVDDHDGVRREQRAAAK